MSPAIPSVPALNAPIFSAAHHLDKRRRHYLVDASPRRGIPRGRTLDESATEHTRLSRGRVVEHAGLAGRHALFAGDQFDFVAAVDRTQPGRLRRARRSHAHEHLDTLADDALERAGADPVDVAQSDAIHPQRRARPHHDAAAGGIEFDDIERRSRRDTQSLALADGEMNDALMAADHMAVEIDDLAGLDRARLQAANDVGVAPGRHEADVLTVLLVGDLEAEAPRQFTRVLLGHVAERKTQVIELLARGREQEITLVAIGIGGANQRPRTIALTARGNVMSGRERAGAEFA